jgi:hypothetical protein
MYGIIYSISPTATYHIQKRFNLIRLGIFYVTRKVVLLINELYIINKIIIYKLN